MEAEIKELIEKILKNQVVIFTKLERLEHPNKVAYTITNGIRDLQREAEKVRLV